ncbi:type IV pilus assembly protein PilM [Salirhabdus euzebyi]|uniref:Type IV pilus assembly protein PilM n=1 Tax=Salirhabdus euzebyi TaxID=394506 RepID=A0A841Q8U6_9BACI|nr:pilus assembly protein PilM [Salirhabdus euzebyi]MBB6455059.1 type IV pilus assembly protein PilM [Salirhabdus euzebyi]
MALFGSNKYVNIEIKDYVIRYAEIKQKKPAIVTNFDEHFFPSGVMENGQIVNDEVFLRTLKHCVKKWKLKGKQVRFIVPDSSVIIRTVDIPADITEEELNGHIYFELGHSIHLPFDNPVVDSVSLGKKGDKQEVLVVASSDEVVNTYYDYLKDENTTPVVADVSSLCQYRLYDHYGLTSDQDVYLLAQFNVKSVTLSIFENHKPVFMQQVSIPYPEDTWKIVPLTEGGILTKEQIDYDKVQIAFDEIYTEMERVLRFYQYSLSKGEKQITKFFIAGDHPYLTELREGVTTRIKEIPLAVLPPEKIQTTKDMKIGYQFYNVIGLAMKEGF